MAPAVRRRSSVAALLGSCFLLLAQRLSSTAFCGGPSAQITLAAVPRRLGNTAAYAEAGSEAVVASSDTSLAISEPLRIGSSITALLKPLLNAQAKLAAGDYDKEAIRALINAESKSAPVVVYTLSQSPFSIDAKRLLTEATIDFKEIEVASLFFLAQGENAAKRAELGEMTGRTSMPHIFINGESIGGLYDGTPGLVPLIESGELEAMVRPPKEDGPLDALFRMFR